jgi:hypothetical protein
MVASSAGDELARVVNVCIAQAGWDPGNSGSVVCFRGTLVAVQSAAVHDKILQLLHHLRSIQQRRHDAVMARASERATPATDPAAYSVVIYHTNMSSGRNENHDEQQQLVKAVKQLIAPPTWQEKKAAIHAVGRRLVVRQRPAVHAEVEKFLREGDFLRPYPNTTMQVD